MGRSYKHLDMRERVVIETQLTLGRSVAAISASLMRTRSTVTREMVRNGWKPVYLHRGRVPAAGGYHSVAADRRACMLAARPRVLRKLVPDTPLWLTVVDHLRRGLSPAQIASTLARMPDPVRLSYETIYTAFYTMPCGHLRSSLLALMRRRHHARRPRNRKDGRSKPSIPNMTLIDQRPIEIQMRLIPGHWE